MSGNLVHQLACVHCCPAAVSFLVICLLQHLSQPILNFKALLLAFIAVQQLFHVKNLPAAAFEPARLLLADRTMYAVHPIPLSEVKAIRKHAPSFGWQYIVLVLVNGLTLPPLYFGTGGVRALFAALKQVYQPTGHKCWTPVPATPHPSLTVP
jgi:hypothetical protein